MSLHKEISFEDEICAHLAAHGRSWAAAGFRKERGNPSPEGRGVGVRGPCGGRRRDVAGVHSPSTERAGSSPLAPLPSGEVGRGEACAGRKCDVVDAHSPSTERAGPLTPGPSPVGRGAAIAMTSERRQFARALRKEMARTEEIRP
jgi:hypothetical protein